MRAAGWVAVLSLLVLQGQARAGIVLQDLGTAAPPGSIGGYTLTAFAPDATPIGTNELVLPTPDGTLTFGTPAEHLKIGSGWATWSNGYTGDVYYSNGATSETMTLAPGAGAFVFYAEPNPLATYTFTATASDGSTLTESIDGAGGASGFGLYGTGGATISSVAISSSVDFAVGEFSIAPAAATPEPSTLISGAIAGLLGLGHAWRRRKARAVA